MPPTTAKTAKSTQKERIRKKNTVSKFPPGIYDPDHPYKDWDPCAPYVLSDEEEAALRLGEFVDLG